jgi:hybrid cluster-associated redox disulfide protein
MQKIDASISVRELLERFPIAMTVFIQRRMLCVGCPTKAFHSLADVARIHGCSLKGLLDAINRIVAGARGTMPDPSPTP